MAWRREAFVSFSTTWLFRERPREQIPLTGIDWPSAASSQALEDAEVFMVGQMKSDLAEKSKDRVRLI